MNYKKRYGILNRLLYRVAFYTKKTQYAFANFEKKLYQEKLKKVSINNPVFISGLPRAGTTILLRLLWRTNEFATYIYQDMPFILCPLLWHKYSSYFTKDTGKRERTHGDGIKISGKSPEAFEELIWKYFWPDHYQTNNIKPWTSGEKNKEFSNFFKSHIKKIITIRKSIISKQGRYLSKNNLNISRLALLPEPFNKGVFLVPFREPLQQAASMLRQHKRLLSIQKKNSFITEYMKAIGHHEFGKTLKPINFNNWLNKPSNPSKMTFWVKYWIAAYSFIIEQAKDSVILISYEKLFKKPKLSLHQLQDLLGLPQDKLASQFRQLHSPRLYSVQEKELSKSLLKKASDIYTYLRKKSFI